jgi:hypothetical protein
MGNDEQLAARRQGRKRHGGPYLATPIIYDDLLYICADPGVLSAYDAITGERAYRRRSPLGGGGLRLHGVSRRGRRQGSAMRRRTATPWW